MISAPHTQRRARFQQRKTGAFADALTGESDVAPVMMRVASSPAVITSAPRGGFVPRGRDGCAALRSYTKMKAAELRFCRNLVLTGVWPPN
jgi:hypothetical protein